VRRRITAALSHGAQAGPDGVTTRRQLLSEQRGVLRDDEAEHAGRLIRT
jgi:hypothetical protein